MRNEHIAYMTTRIVVVAIQSGQLNLTDPKKSRRILPRHQ